MAPDDILAWLNHRLMERGKRVAREVVEVTVVYERHDHTMTSMVFGDSRRPMVFCADGGWTETCDDQEHADRQRLFWDRETPTCAPHRVSWEPAHGRPAREYAGNLPRLSMRSPGGHGGPR